MKLPALGRPMSTEGFNAKNKEWWTTIGGRKIYAKSLESLYRTVAYGWIATKDHSSEGDLKFKCLYCGREWYIISEPCHCIMNKGDTGKRFMALKRLNELIYNQKQKEEEVNQKKSGKRTESGIILA